MQAFYTCFLKFCLALNSYKKTKSGLFKQPLFCYTIIVMNIGVWRSLVARSAGGPRGRRFKSCYSDFLFLLRVFDDFSHQKLLFF